MIGLRDFRQPMGTVKVPMGLPIPGELSDPLFIRSPVPAPLSIFRLKLGGIAAHRIPQKHSPRILCFVSDKFGTVHIAETNSEQLLIK